jgi:hypothetical protein
MDQLDALAKAAWIALAPRTTWQTIRRPTIRIANIDFRARVLVM